VPARCAAAEEKLQERFEKQKEQRENCDDAGTNNLGVSGFGNLASAAKSKRASRVSETETKQLHDQKWDELLSQQEWS
jgi:hypothetical protein